MLNSFRTTTRGLALASPFVLSLAAAAAQAQTAYTVQPIRSPGPAMGMSEGGAVAGYYVSKCTTLSSQPKRTICYNAPWVFDGARVSKLAGAFGSTANAKAVAVNDALTLIGADTAGAWYYAGGTVTHTDDGNPDVRGTRLSAINTAGVAVGMSYVAGVYGPVSYTPSTGVQSTLRNGLNTVDINDAGMVAGWFKDPTDNTERGFVTDAFGAVTPIPPLATGANCRTVHLSEVGTSGEVWVAGHCAGRPFIYSPVTDTLLELGNLAGYNSLSVQAVNSSGTAVGTGVRPGAAAPDGYTAVIWSGAYDSPQDLAAIQPFAPAGCWNVHSTDINEAGVVLTGCNDTSGGFYTWLLRPSP